MEHSRPFAHLPTIAHARTLPNTLEAALLNTDSFSAQRTDEWSYWITFNDVEGAVHAGRYPITNMVCLHR